MAPQGVPGREQLVDGGVAFAGPRHQAPLAAAHITQPVRLSWRRRAAAAPAGSGPGGGPLASPGSGLFFFEAGAVRYDRFLGVFGEVVPQMPAVGDLDRVGCAVPGALGVVAGPVPADHLRAWMGLEPGLQGAGFPVRQQLDRLPGGDVHQDSPVDLALPQREVVDPEDLRRGADRRLGQGGDQAQQRGAVHRGAQRGGQPGPGPAGQRQPDLGQ